jgi:hypothetical protein
MNNLVERFQRDSLSSVSASEETASNIKGSLQMVVVSRHKLHCPVLTNQTLDHVRF